jgi:predicted transcriptional regulator
MTAASPKQRMLDILAKLPEDASFEDAMERLYLLEKVERGLEQVRDGRTVSHEDVAARFGR